MCTVTFLPVNNNKYILTSNRDEDVERPSALPFAEYTVGAKHIYFPKDQQAQGSWIAHDPNGYTLCLLNGAYEAHTRKASYKKSRGIMLLDFFEYNDPQRFADNYEFSGIEPFTLLMVYSCTDTNQTQLHEIKWNETSVDLIQYDATLPHIWSSATLYTPQIINERKQWFNTWLDKNSNYTTDAILFFHHFGGVGTTYNDLVINRGNKKTVSISCIHKMEQLSEIIYEDITNKQLYKNKIISC
jgi:hypothetical protein